MEEKEVSMDTQQPTLNLAIYSAVPRFKSIRRSIKRGHVTPWGEEYPKRPFNNKRRTPGRNMQLIKQKIYQDVTNRK